MERSVVEKPIVVIFAGTSGVGKIEFIERIAKELPGDRRPKIVDFEKDYIEKKIMPLTTFLESDEKNRNSTWIKAFGNFYDHFREWNKKEDFILISMHIVNANRYYHEGTYIDFFSPVSWNAIRSIAPTVIITLIDDVYEVYDRVKASESTKHGPQKFLTHYDLIRWRQKEIDISSILSKELYFAESDVPLKVSMDYKLDPEEKDFFCKPKPKFFVVSRQQGAFCLRDIILSCVNEDEFIKIYASFPITNTKREEKYTDIVDDFRTKLLEHPNFIVFDPLAIDEIPFSRFLEKKHINPTIAPWPKRENYKEKFLRQKEFFEQDLKKARAESLKKEFSLLVNQQIRARDYQLISQSDGIAAFDPYFPNGKVSGGVRSEMHEGRITGKYVYVLDKGFYEKESKKELNKEKKGIFSQFNLTSHRVFHSIEELIRGFEDMTK